MSLSKEKKVEIIKTYGVDENDTGSIAVQIALLTEDINGLQDHFKVHKKDRHSRRGLIRKVNRRRAFLDYMAKKDNQAYLELIKRLGLRR